MKLYIIFFILLSLTLCENYVKTPREFLSSFLKAYKGSDYTLPAKCLDGDFNLDLNKIIPTINRENILTFLMLSKKVTDKLAADCPFQELSYIFNTYNQLITSGDIINKSKSHMQEVFTIIKSIINKSDWTVAELGTALGTYTKVILKTEKTLLFLDYYSFDWKLFLEGMLKGLSNNETGENKCTHDIEDFKPEIIKAFSDVYEAFKSFDFGKALTDIVNLISILKGFNTHCHFDELSADLISITTEWGVAKLLFRITMHGPTIYSDIKQCYKTYKEGQFDQTGKFLGNAVKLALSFSIE
jgi:hypothetical protein